MVYNKLTFCDFILIRQKLISSQSRNRDGSRIRFKMKDIEICAAKIIEGNS